MRVETAALTVVLETLGTAAKVALERHEPATVTLETTVSATVVLEIHGPVKVVLDTLDPVKEVLETTGTQVVVPRTLGSVIVVLEAPESVNVVLEILLAPAEAFDGILSVTMERKNPALSLSNHLEKNYQQLSHKELFDHEALQDLSNQ